MDEWKGYLDVLASKAPVPGGGGASAICAALGAALGEMVGNLTTGKKKYAEWEDKTKDSIESLKELREWFVKLSEEDAQVFEPLSKAYGIKAETEEEKKAKEEYMETCLDAAAQVPCLTGGGQFITYDDPESAAAKGALARKRGLGGVGFWELSQDTAGDLIQSAWNTWNGGRFQDVPQDAWYAGAVERVCAAGLMNGTSPTAFSPGETVTRGQITAILHRLAGKPEVRGSSFSDVPDSAYYSGAVAWAARRGVVEGFYDGTFRPDLPVSRQQLASILWRYAKLERADRGSRASLRGFPDAGDVADYAGEAMSWALAEGILQGTKEGRLQPQGRAARGQTAVLLERFQTLLERT